MRYETKPGVPHRAQKRKVYVPQAERYRQIEATVEEALELAEEARRGGGGESVSEEKKRELRRRLDDVIERCKRQSRGTAQTTAPDATREATGAPKPASESYWAAWNMRRLCMDLLDSLLPFPTPLVEWRSPEEMAQRFGSSVGLCTNGRDRIQVELSTALSPREAAAVTAHELCHVCQFHGGAKVTSDAEREVVEEQAERFALLAVSEYIERYGPLPK